MRSYDRIRRLVERYISLDFCYEFVLSTINDEPRSIKDAFNSKQGKLWKKDMIDEMETWDLVEFPDGNKPIGSKRVFKKKLNVARKVKKYKA